jgi:hypothetical protein
MNAFGMKRNKSDKGIKEKEITALKTTAIKVTA